MYSLRGETRSLIAFYILLLFIDQLTNKLVQSYHLIKSTLTSFSNPTAILLALLEGLQSVFRDPGLGLFKVREEDAGLLL